MSVSNPAHIGDPDLRAVEIPSANGIGQARALAKIYEDSGEYELAEATLLKGKEAKPNDPAVHMQLAGFYDPEPRNCSGAEPWHLRTAL